MTIHYLPTPALSESVWRALGRLEELCLADVVGRVRNDYGRVSERSVIRYLAAMARHGHVVRNGKSGAYTYRRACK